MKKRITLSAETRMTLEDGCNKYLDNCRQRNLSEITILHYRESYRHFYKFYGKDMPLTAMDKTRFDDFLGYLRSITENDLTIQSYQKNLITVLRFLMKEGDVKRFDMQRAKATEKSVETYTDEELHILLKKPNLRKCSFTEYECWVIVNFLFSTGVRERSLINIKVGDVDLDNAILTVRVTKNRKVLVIPISQTLVSILKEFLKHRKHNSQEDWLFCNTYGDQLIKTRCYQMIQKYHYDRGVETTGLHRYRHTFAKHWILNGGNVVTLSKLLGHSSLDITQHYINLVTTDLTKQVEEINLLDKFSTAKRKIKL